MIVDDAVMGQYVLRHRWIDAEIQAAHAQLVQHLPGPTAHAALQNWRSRYAAILLWAGQVVRENPAILETFAARVAEALGPHPTPSGCETFEAAAFEWLLLGLVELPPAGVHPSGSPPD